MKKIIVLFALSLLVSACAHVSENIIGYNERGQTIVRVCKSRGNLGTVDAYGSSCTIEVRDYGRISNQANTINIISNDNR